MLAPHFGQLLYTFHMHRQELRYIERVSQMKSRDRRAWKGRRLFHLLLLYTCVGQFGGKRRESMWVGYFIIGLQVPLVM